jgi:hypothetical protein
MKYLILFTLLISAFKASAFDMQKDGLCFLNANEDLKRFGPLGVLGSSKGVCQGMSGLVAAFYEHAKFVPSEEKMSDFEASVAVSELRRYHSGDCSLNKKVKISGFSNLNEFCLAHKDLLMANAIDYNTDIAIREISWNLEEFLLLKKSPMTTLYGRTKLHQNVEALRKIYRSGRQPLLLYHSHVVAVHKVTIHLNKELLTKVVFGIYDSNYKTSVEYVVHYSPDGLPTAGQKMIWNTTPSRTTTVCW